MQKEYRMPELRLAGEADKVVFGAGAGGFDYDSEVIFCSPPYQDDEPSVEAK